MDVDIAFRLLADGDLGFVHRFYLQSLSG